MTSVSPPKDQAREDERVEKQSLGRFGHHPDASTDFCIEVDALQGWAVDMKAGLRSQWPYWARLSALLRFVRSDAFGNLDEIAQRAKPAVFDLEGAVLTPSVPPSPADPVRAALEGGESLTEARLARLEGWAWARTDGEPLPDDGNSERQALNDRVEAARKREILAEMVRDPRWSEGLPATDEYDFPDPPGEVFRAALSVSTPTGEGEATAQTAASGVGEVREALGRLACAEKAMKEAESRDLKAYAIEPRGLHRTCEMDRASRALEAARKAREAAVQSLITLSRPVAEEPAALAHPPQEGEREREIEALAEHLHEEHGYDKCATWPTHQDDDGYRGNGRRVTITPPDVQARLREQAGRILTRVDQLRRPTVPLPPSKSSGEEA